MNHLSRIVTIVLALSLGLALLVAAYPAAAEEEQNPHTNPKLGSIVTFGRYEQDNDPENGQEPIEWFVVDLDKANRRVLLLSRYVLDAYPYNLVDLFEWDAYVAETERENDLIRQTHEQQAEDAIRWFEEELDAQLLIDAVDEIAYRRGTEPRIEQIMETLRELYEPRKAQLPKPVQTEAFRSFYEDYCSSRGEAAGTWLEFVCVVERMVMEDLEGGQYNRKREASQWYQKALTDEGFDARYDGLLEKVREDMANDHADKGPGPLLSGLVALCSQKANGEEADFKGYLSQVYENILAEYPELRFPEDAVQDSAELFVIALRDLTEGLLGDHLTGSEQKPDWIHKEEFDFTVAEIRDAIVSLHQSVDLAAEGAAKYSFMVNFGDKGLYGEKIWQSSDLRAWLNREFLDRAFDEAEKALILPDEQDFVMVWRFAEIANYARLIDYTSIRTCEATAYAAACGVEIIQDEWTDRQRCWYWHIAPYRLNSGYYYNASDGVTPKWLELDSYGGVRPAVWVSMDADIF